MARAASTARVVGLVAIPGDPPWALDAVHPVRTLPPRCRRGTEKLESKEPKASPSA